MTIPSRTHSLLRVSVFALKGQIQASAMGGLDRGGRVEGGREGSGLGRPSVSWSGPVIRSCQLREEVGGAAGGGRGRRRCVGRRFVVSSDRMETVLVSCHIFEFVLFSLSRVE